jgi:2-oxoglutarate ferredoxin oxidoreductase subunit beta
VRTAVNNPTNDQRTKKCLKVAFQKQMDNVGFGFVEILEACPTLWRMSPIESLQWLENEMIAEFPLGEFKNVDKI